MYGRRDELCAELEKMFAPEEPLALLVWTEECVLEICCVNLEHPVTDEEIRGVQALIGEMPMEAYQKNGVNAATVTELLARHRETVNRRVDVPAVLLGNLVAWLERELAARESEAREAGAPVPESTENRIRDVAILKKLLDA